MIELRGLCRRPLIYGAAGRQVAGLPEVHANAGVVVGLATGVLCGQDTLGVAGVCAVQVGEQEDLVDEGYGVGGVRLGLVDNEPVLQAYLDDAVHIADVTGVAFAVVGGPGRPPYMLPTIVST